MPSAFSWPVLVPSALRAPAPVNYGVRLFEKQMERKRMSVFVVRGERNPMAFAAILFLVLCIPLRAMRPEPVSFTEWALYSLVAVFFTYLLARAILRSTEFIALDRENGTLVQCTRDLLLRKRTSTHPLPQFKAVSSHLMFGRLAPNAVSLLTAEKFALCLLATAPASTAASFWSMPRTTEAPKAKALREALAKYLGINDLGFRAEVITYKALKLH